MNKIVSAKNASAIFLVTVLILGTFAAISPSSFMVGAQAIPQYGMEREYGSYEQPEYGMDSYEKPSFRNDNYEQPEYYEQPREYPSYQPDYKPEYPSDNSYKSKKDSSSKSVSINKLNCINNNVNINGNNTGDINLGNKGQGYSDGYSSAAGGYGSGEGYGKQGKGFGCIINNNNTNTNIVTGGGGNVTDGNGNVTETTCEECFDEFENTTALIAAIVALPDTGTIPLFGLTLNLADLAGITDEETLCAFLESLPVGITEAEFVTTILLLISAPGVDLAGLAELFDCLVTAGTLPAPP